MTDLLEVLLDLLQAAVDLLLCLGQAALQGPGRQVTCVRNMKVSLSSFRGVQRGGSGEVGEAPLHLSIQIKYRSTTTTGTVSVQIWSTQKWGLPFHLLPNSTIYERGLN